MIPAPRPADFARPIPREEFSMATMTEPIPGKLSDKVSFRPRYGNYIGGKWTEPASGQYFENVTPITGKTFCEIPRSNAQDIERALDAAHAARESWGHTSPTHRAILMNKIAQRMEDNLDILALAETWDNGKPIRETVNADLPLAIDHWRYFAGCIRAQEGTISEIDHDTVAYHIHDPRGGVGPISAWN
jgi:aldehyde dehydrogenase